MPSEGIEKLPLKWYQGESIQHLLAQPFAALLLGPGLGKTLVTLVVFWLLRRAGFVSWLLVVAPLRPAYQVWPYEVLKWKFPFKVEILHGDQKDAALARAADIYVVNYDGLPWLHSRINQLTKRGVGWLVCDESTHVKHISSTRHRTIKTMIHCFGRRTILTGTPLPNGYVDLFGQMIVVDQGKRLGTWLSYYKSKHFHQIDENGMVWTREMGKPAGRLRDVPTTEGQKDIQKLLADVSLWYDDEDLGLPRWRDHTIFIDLPKKARQIYDQLEADFLTAVDLEGEQAVLVNATNAGVLGMKLRQIANGGLKDETGRHVEVHLEKAHAVKDYLEELGGRSLLVAFEFHHDAERLRKVLGDVPSVSGKVKIKEALALMDRLNQGKEQILLVQSSMMEGLNLQEGCSDVCWHSQTWNAQHYIQLIKRVHRQGQKHRVTVAHVVARNTRDERVLQVVKRKKFTQDDFLRAIRSIRGN